MGSLSAWPFLYESKVLLLSSAWEKPGAVMDGCRMEFFTPICENRDFRRAYARGKSFVTPVVVVYVLKNRCHCLRIGITTSKKIGNAVQRNRSRRVIREAARSLAPKIKDGYDLVLVARTKTPFVKSTEVTKALEQQLEKAGIFK